MHSAEKEKQKFHQPAYRLMFALLVHLLIVLGAFGAALLVRFDLNVPAEYWHRAVEMVPAVLAIKVLLFWRAKLLKDLWRFVSIADLIKILNNNLVASLLLVCYAVLVYRLEFIPRSVLVLDGIFCFLLMGGIRFFSRAIQEQYLPKFFLNKERLTRTLVVGAGSAGQMIVKEIRSNPQLGREAVCFVDDDPSKFDQKFQGVKVFGGLECLKDLVLGREIDEVVIAIPSASGTIIKRVVNSCREIGVTFRILPGVGELIDGSVSVQQLREVSLEDLLGRKPISLDEAQIRSYLQGKRVLVTGAGGSIGSEICRQVVRFKPEKLILFENAETPLFLIEKELLENYPEITVIPIIGDVRNPARVDVIFDELMPQVVFHAAAYKHVPMMENNPAEAVNNNVRGTKLLADAADRFGVETFVMVSTDKAVRPTNVMGASKRVAELYVQSLAKQSKTRYVTTRFGNVLGSNGSVIPTFKEQIKNGGPLTVTHPEVTRFFMTIPEATQLVLQAGSMGQGGEIYLFDMGEPVKIAHLAEELIRLSGLQPHEDIEIVYTGLRPGEKLYEELLLAEEGALPTHHDKICVASSAPPSRDTLLPELEKLFAAAKALNLAEVKSQLRVIVPEYQPSEHKPSAKVVPHPASAVHE